MGRSRKIKMSRSLRVRRYYWINKTTQERVDGVAILRRHDQQLLTHLTAEQARAMADKLHDLADMMESNE